ncbi:MAG: GntR family transcriptional regulator [Erysipelotrichaceae bacterium]
MRKMTLDILIANEIRYIIDTQLTEGDKLASERELAEIFMVERQTVRVALKHLLQEGWIISQERSGYYVSKKRIERSTIKLESTSEVVKAMGKKIKLNTISLNVIEANKKISKKVKVSIGTKLYEFIRLRTIDNEPVSLESAYIEFDLAPNLYKNDLENNSFFEILKSEYGIQFTESQQELLVVDANKLESELLEVPIKTPLVMQRGLIYDKMKKHKSYHEAVMLMNRFVFVNEV